MRTDRLKQAYIQARAIVGDRHFVLSDPDKSQSIWAVPGYTVLSTEINKDGVEVRSFGAVPTRTTAELRAFANARGEQFQINPSYQISRV